MGSEPLWLTHLLRNQPIRCCKCHETTNVNEYGGIPGHSDWADVCNTCKVKAVIRRRMCIHNCHTIPGNDPTEIFGPFGPSPEKLPLRPEYRFKVRCRDCEYTAIVIYRPPFLNEKIEFLHEKETT